MRIGKNYVMLSFPQENTAVDKTVDLVAFMVSFHDSKLKCRRPVMWLSSNIQPGQERQQQDEVFQIEFCEFAQT